MYDLFLWLLSYIYRASSVDVAPNPSQGKNVDNGRSLVVAPALCIRLVSANQQNREPAKQYVSKTTKQCVNTTAKQHNSETAKQRNSKTAKQQNRKTLTSVSQYFSQSVLQSVSTSVSQYFSQSVLNSVSTDVNQSVGLFE